MQARTEICVKDQVSVVKGLPEDLVQVLQALHEKGIAAFVTRYDGAEQGKVVGANTQFFDVCGQKAGHFLGRTYRQIHSHQATADAYSAAEHSVRQLPYSPQRVFEGDTVDVLKVALPGDAFLASPETRSSTFILGVFVVVSREKRMMALHPSLVLAHAEIKKILPAVKELA